MTPEQIQAFLDGLAKLSNETGVVIVDGGEGVFLAPTSGASWAPDVLQPLQYGCNEDGGYLTYHETFRPNQNYVSQKFARLPLKSKL